MATGGEGVESLVQSGVSPLPGCPVRLHLSHSPKGSSALPQWWKGLLKDPVGRRIDEEEGNLKSQGDWTRLKVGNLSILEP